MGDHPHLLAALREELDVTSPKDGCSPSGQCGCCTVLVDGKPAVACNLALDRVAGKAVTTLEGLPAEERDRYAAAFAATGALQCGFCTPGIVMRAKYLVDKDGPALTREKAARHLGGHLCRCTGYHPILDAVDLLAAGSGDPRRAPRRRRRRPEPQVPGRRARARRQGLRRRHARPRHAARRPRPRRARPGRRRGHRQTAAAAVPGVERVLTAADVPGELRIGLIHRDWPVFIPVGGRTSYTGDVLALVVAADRATARRAAELVEVDYGPLPPFADALAALDATEPAVWGRRRRSPTCCPARPTPATTAPATGRRRARRQRPHRPRGVPDPAHRARLPRARVDPGRAARRRHAGGVLRRPGRVGRPPPDRRRARRRTRTASSSTSSPTAAPSAARRTAPTRPRPPWPLAAAAGR